MLPEDDSAAAAARFEPAHDAAQARRRTAEGSGSLDGPSEADPDLTESADETSYAIPGRRVNVRGAAAFRDPGRYEILNEHGRGGLGRVSRAHDKDLGRDIAVKELLTRGPVNELRFAREAMITARLQHPGIVPIYEAGRWPDGTPFYAMKLVAGQSLRELLSERTTVAERIALLHHVIAVADAMAYAHERNIIHRDLKPANVIVGDFGETVVIDWGLAKDLSEADELGHGEATQSPDRELTSIGSVLGTPAYMPPEQERGERVDRRADVFAIGAMLWELCSLQKVPPTDLALRRRMFRAAGIDPDLVTIIEKALAPDPARRYPHAGALAADLKAFKSGARIAARSYSLWAMLAHWTRRHRALALSVATAVSIATVVGVSFVHNLAVARDRADAALTSARQERDRAVLAEAALVMSQNPNHARDLLVAFTTHTPQVALLTARARHVSATRVVPLPSSIHGLFRASGSPFLHVRTNHGELWRVDPRTGAMAFLDRGLTEAFTYRGTEALYGRTASGGPAARVATSTDADAWRAGDLPGITQIAALRDATYALDDTGDLYRFDGARATVIAHRIHGIAGDGERLLVCHRDGELEVMRRGEVVLRRRCPQTKSAPAMVVVGDDYAALTESGALLVSHGGRVRELPTVIRYEYEISMSARGVVAISDYGAQGKAWFARPDGSSVEPAPLHAAAPWSVAADGDLVAWGYEDGMVSAVDTRSGATWEFHGHVSSVPYVALDAANARLVSANPHELRIWNVAPPVAEKVATLACSSFHLEPSPDRRRVALDCNDGSVSVWSRSSGTITQVHRHTAWSNGLGWLGDRLCSGAKGNGQLLCSNLDGQDLTELDVGGLGISSMVTLPDRSALVVGAHDGKVWRVDRALHLLYAESGRGHDSAVSADGHYLASCERDGIISVFDLARSRLIEQRMAHPNASCDVEWTGSQLWSAGGDGTLKRWDVGTGRLRLAQLVQARAALHLLTPRHGGWIAAESTGTLLFSEDGVRAAVRVDTGGTISSIDISPDQRYVAVSLDHEIIVIDLLRNAIASNPEVGPVRQLRFLEPGLLVFSEPTALRTLAVDQLTYEPFERTPEPRNVASF